MVVIEEIENQGSIEEENKLMIQDEFDDVLFEYQV